MLNIFFFSHKTTISITAPMIITSNMYVYTPIQVHMYTFEIRNFVNLIQYFSNITPMTVLCVVVPFGEQIKTTEISTPLQSNFWEIGVTTFGQWPCSALAVENEMHDYCTLSKKLTFSRMKRKPDYFPKHTMMSIYSCVQLLKQNWITIRIE